MKPLAELFTIATLLSAAGALMPNFPTTTRLILAGSMIVFGLLSLLLTWRDE